MTPVKSYPGKSDPSNKVSLLKSESRKRCPQVKSDPRDRVGVHFAIHSILNLTTHFMIHFATHFKVNHEVNCELRSELHMNRILIADTNNL